MSWTKIEEVTLSSSQASVTLGTGGTLPQTYKTLKVVTSTRASGAFTSSTLAIAFNGVSTNQSMRFLNGNGSSASSGTDTTIYGYTTAGSNTANTFASTEFTIPNYTGSTNKPVGVDNVQEDNVTTSFQFLIAGLWSSSSAITSITFSSNGGNWVAGSTFTVYGLK